MSGPERGSARRLPIRPGAERSLLLMIVAFIFAVVGTRWYLEATGYPQIGGGELHIAHMLWGGALLIVAVILPLVVDAAWVLSVSAVLAGAGAGLFIDEIGKFITTSNDYFYPLAAPLIYGLLLIFVLLFVLVRWRPGGGPAVVRPGRVARWEDAHLARRRYRRLLIALLVLTGTGWILSLIVLLLLDAGTLRALIDQMVNLPRTRVERPTDPALYLLEAAILAASAVLLIGGAVGLGTGHEQLGANTAAVGLVVALTAGAVVSLYVEQVSAILPTLLNGALLFAVIHYRDRFPTPTDPAGAALDSGRPQIDASR